MPPRPRRDDDPNTTGSADVAVRHELGAWRPGAAGVHAVDLGQEDEQPRADEDRDLRRERVVVAEGDLVGRRRVVLVHDGDGSCVEERLERVASVHVGGAVGDVVACQEHLCREQPLSREGALPGTVELPLPERGRGLELRHRARAPVETELREAERDRARRDDCDGLAASHDPSDLARATTENRTPDRSARPGDEARAELDDDRHRCWVPSPITRYWRSQRSRYVTGPRGPGAQSTLIPVSGAPVSSNPSV